MPVPMARDVGRQAPSGYFSTQTLVLTRRSAGRICGIMSPRYRRSGPEWSIFGPAGDGGDGLGARQRSRFWPSPQPKGSRPGVASPDWVLLSTEGAMDAGIARTVVGWYERRWTIEEYCRALKSGARVEDRRFDALAPQEMPRLRCLRMLVPDIARLARFHPRNSNHCEHHHGLEGACPARSGTSTYRTENNEYDQNRPS